MGRLFSSHDTLYFDNLCRTQKAESVLSLIYATDQAKKYVEKEDVKENIASRLEHAYDLFKKESGSYNGDLKQFSSQYTIGHELGIWKNQDLDLTDLAKKVAQNKITITRYFDIFFLNFIQPVKGIIIHPLYHLLLYMIGNDLQSVSKVDVGNIYKEISGATDVGNINGAYQMLIATSYFDANSKNDELIYVGNMSLNELKNKCDITYVEKGYEEAQKDLDSEETYLRYLLNEHAESVELRVLNSKFIPKPYQRIFFGAPGTGKSYNLNEEAKLYFINNFERVTFHPNYTYGAFVGAYKPFPKYLDEKETITYKYVQGAFMRILVKALLNPSENYLLIIEEINRSNISAVFGDVFQLLDRNKEGFSEYPVYASEEVRLFLNEEIIEKDNVTDEKKMYIKSLLGEELSKLLIPKNMYIWATMNSADQGVMPMDTAFKRRWDFEYISIDKGVTEEFEKYKLQFGENKLVKWNDFRMEINKKLAKCKVSEDKMMGPYFISKNILETEDVEKTTESVKNKVLMYLYEDAGRQHRNKLFVAERASTYFALINNFSQDGNGVFKEGLDIKAEDIETTNDEGKSFNSAKNGEE